MLRLGIIGRRGQAARWAQAALKSPGWKLSSCYHPETAGWNSLLRHSDALVIASPTTTHLRYLSRLSRSYRGFVLVEKPVVSSWSECRALLKKTPPGFLRRVAVAHNWRLYPWVEKIREILRRDPKSPVLSAYFELTHDYGFKPGYASSWRSRKKTHPIGPAETQGIHPIDLIHHLFGPIEWVAGGASRLGRVGSAPDTSSLFLKTRNGVFCSIHTSYVAPVSYYARVMTSRAVLTYQDGRLQIQKQPRPKEGNPSRPAAHHTLRRDSLEELFQQSVVRQLAELKNLLSGRSKRSPLASFYEGAADVAVLEGFARSLRRGGTFSMKGLPLYSVLCRPRS